MIELDGQVRRGDLVVTAELRARPDEVIGIVGENGAGKTTLLRVLAGLTPLDTGRLSLDGTVVDEPATATFVAPEARPVGLARQVPLLFPHLDLRDNVAFGLRRGGMAKEAARSVATAWLEQVGVAEHARSRPHAVSGGQAQRAALARALARDPDLLLLDEPLAALDQEGRTLVRRLLRTEERRPGRTTVLVTHDPVDALSLTDRVVVLEAGRVVQVATPAELTRRPRSDFVARLVGLNLLRGRRGHDGPTRRAPRRRGRGGHVHPGDGTGAGDHRPLRRRPVPGTARRQPPQHLGGDRGRRRGRGRPGAGRPRRPRGPRRRGDAVGRRRPGPRAR